MIVARIAILLALLTAPASRGAAAEVVHRLTQASQHQVSASATWESIALLTLGDPSQGECLVNGHRFFMCLTADMPYGHELSYAQPAKNAVEILKADYRGADGEVPVDGLKRELVEQTSNPPHEHFRRFTGAPR